MIAEVTLRELGRPTLGELLELTALIAAKDPARRSRVAARWLLRYLEENDGGTIEDAALAASALAALGGPSHEAAHAVLSGMAERASSRRRRTRVAS